MSRVRRLINLALVVGVLALSSGCVSQESTRFSDKSAVLRGMVYNENRVPVLDAEVRWVAQGKVLAEARTDLHGRYLLPQVAFGPVSLQFSKPGYEPLEWSFRFEQPTQVVYVQMSNLSELLDDLADNIQKRDWNSAQAYLARIKTLAPDDAVASYLEGLMLSRQSKPEEAAALLERLSLSNRSSFAIELTLADLYEDTLKLPEKALTHLKRALAIQDDVDVESRIANLEKMTATGP